MVSWMEKHLEGQNKQRKRQETGLEEQSRGGREKEWEHQSYPTYILNNEAKRSMHWWIMKLRFPSEKHQKFFLQKSISQGIQNINYTLNNNHYNQKSMTILINKTNPFYYQHHSEFSFAKLLSRNREKICKFLVFLFMCAFLPDHSHSEKPKGKASAR